MTTKAKTATVPENGETVFIPLNKLKKHPKNARKTPHSEASIEAKAASIAVKGILQNLVVEPERDSEGEPTGCYLVSIGEGRRLAQMLRVKRKEIKKTEPIRCVIDTANDAAEISLDENVTRENLHPADEFERFRELSEDRGWGAEEIAARFGTSAHVVKQRLRLKELPPNAKFADFLASELIPWIRSRYNVTRDPNKTVVAGSSFGGIAATYAALRHSEIFGAVLCQSGSFRWAPDHRYGGEPTTETGWLAKQFIKSPKLPIRFYMDAGLFEVDYVGSGGAILEPSRNMRDVLLAKGYDIHYREFVSGHDYLNWRGTLADGLITLLGATQSVGVLDKIK